MNIPNVYQQNVPLKVFCFVLFFKSHFLSSAWEFLQNRSHTRTQGKTQQHRETEITSCIRSDHNEIKLDISSQERLQKQHKLVEIKQRTSER